MSGATDIRIRRARSEDHPTYARLFLELGVDDPIPDLEHFTADIVPKMLVAESSDGAPLGYTVYHVMGEALHVRQLVTDEAARRRGVGRALMSAVAEIGKERRCGWWQLNVRPHNAGAIAFYERVGLSKSYQSRALKIAWADVEAYAGPRAVGVSASVIELDDEARVEQAMGFVRGQLRAARAGRDRLLVMLEEGAHVVGAATVDLNFPGAFPFRVARPDLAIELLHAIRARSRPTDTLLHMTIDDRPDVVDALLAMGAAVRLEIQLMKGPLPG